MVKIDLITGFLGCGKTTFIKKYAKYLMDRGMNIGILENDFGAVNVDMMMLNELEGDKCELEMIAGGCDKETHIRRFRTKLIAMGMCGYDRVIVEPSGIYDVDEFFDVLMEEPLDKWYQIGNVITIVDAKLEDNLSEEADFVLASEAACAGTVVISHFDEAENTQLEKTFSHLNNALSMIQCERRYEISGDDIVKCNINEMTEKDFDKLINAGYKIENYCKMDIDINEVFKTEYFMNLKHDGEILQKVVRALFSDNKYGSIFRVKGFFKEKDDKGWMQLNATREKTNISTIDKGQDVLIVIGKDINKEEISHLLESV
ncbi:MAG: GTP-binding protein [Lachnospira sp.]|nr:GTP-binding protein [Lachnospira sp.]